MKARALSFFGIFEEAGASLSVEEFERIYIEYRIYVRRCLYWMVGPEWVDDLVQETFIKIWKKGHQFKGQSNFQTWIYRVAVNTAKDHWKKNERELSWSIATSFGSDEKNIILSQLIDQAIFKIPLKQRSCFILFYKLELSVDEVAESLKIPVGTVKSRLSKGRKIFTEFLKSHGVHYE